MKNVITKLQMHILIIMIISVSLTGCIFDKLESSGPTDTNDGFCTCCYAPYDSSYECSRCEVERYPKKQGKSCAESFKSWRPFGVCCNNNSLHFELNDKEILAKFFLNQISSQKLLVSLNTKPTKGALSSYTNDNLFPQKEYSKTCEEICTDESSPFCMIIRASNTPELAQQIDDFAEMIFNSQEEINKNSIMQIFDISEDPCERNNLILTNNTIVNEGKNCEFSTKFNFANNNEKIISISMPGKLSGQINLERGINVNFPNYKSTCYLEIVNDSLTEDFGGWVSTVHYDTKQFIIGTNNGCITIR